jgi:curli production assembly/transport component CsgG/holdfast attachment protein HfaB
MESRIGLAVAALSALLLGACTSTRAEQVTPLVTSPVTDNSTPFTQCLSDLHQPGAANWPRVAVGEVGDKTGQTNLDNEGTALTQGTAEMVMSALARTGMVSLVERYDLRVPLAEVQLTQQGLVGGRVDADFQLAPFDFLILGALTELNYNIVSGGVGLHVAGIGGGVRRVVINVALDLRVVDATNLAVRHVASLQKQVIGVEVEANVFRFFGGTLVEFDAGRIRNEPLQLGVRSVVEMAVYQIMTDFLGLPASEECTVVRPTYLQQPV